MPSLEIGGAERSLIGLLEALENKSVQVSVFLYRREGEFIKDLPQYVRLLPEIPAYRAYTEPILSLVKHGRLRFATARLLAKLTFFLYGTFMRKPTGTWTHLQYISAFLQPFLPNIPGEYDLAAQYLGVADTLVYKVNAKYKVAWNHTDYATQHPNPKLDRRVYTNVDYIVSVSESCTEAFRRMYPAFSQKAVTVENCLARELIERKSLLPAAGMYREAGETVLLSVGRFCEAKNFESIPKICTVLLKRGLSVKWYILGYGDREAQIREAIQAVHMEDFVVLLGKKENPYPYIRMCDIYVQPSVYEGKCVAVREAQLLGKPVIITDFPTAHSQLRDGTDGMIAPLDFDGFTDALAALIQDNEKQEALKAACHSTDFTQYKEAEKILKFAEGRESYAEDQRHCADLQRRKISRAVR